MSKARMHLIIVSIEEREGLPPTRGRVRDAWAYFEKSGTIMVLRVDEKGNVLRLTEGARDEGEPSSYDTLFETVEGTQAKVAISRDEKPLSEAHVKVRLESVTVTRTIGVSTRDIKELTIPSKGVKKPVATLPFGRVDVAEYTPHAVARSLAVTLFGGRGSDIHAAAMDRFLRKNYGAPGARPVRFQGRASVHPEHAPGRSLDELRRTINASGQKAIDLIRDIGRAAKSLEVDDAAERVVGLVAHGFEGGTALGRVGNDIVTDNDLRHVERAKLDIAKAELDLRKAEQDDDPSAIDDARENLARVKSRPEAVFLEACNEAAAALARAHCKLVELQACNSGGPEVSVGDPFGFKSRLARLLSSQDHPVEVRGHSQFITTDIANGAVFIGYDREDARRDNSQYSTDTLPVP